MDTEDSPPLVFAHQVIKQFADHLVGDGVKLDAQAYRVIRLVFRRIGGSWFELCSGSPRHTDLLIQTVRAWGKGKSQNQ